MDLRNKMKLAVFIASLSAASAAIAAPAIDGWYSSVFGGYAYLPNNIHNTRYGITRSNANYQSGFDAGGNLGFKSNPMRYEGELSYIQANANSFELNHFRQFGVNGYSNAILGMANIYYDFLGITEAIQPFLGLGIGYAGVQVKLNSTAPFGITHYNHSNAVFAYQATGGLTYNFAENYALSLGYRYVATSTVPELGQMFQANLANLGAVYRFDGNNYK